jgi:hypothetical protein
MTAEEQLAAHRELHRADRAALIDNYETQLRVLREEVQDLRTRYVPRLRRKTRLIAKAESMSARFRKYMSTLKDVRERRG